MPSRPQKTRYVLHPGWVTSKEDGESHYVTVTALAQLYHIPLGACIDASFTKNFRNDRLNELIHLWPQASGNYTLPEESNA